MIRITVLRLTTQARQKRLWSQRQAWVDPVHPATNSPESLIPIAVIQASLDISFQVIRLSQGASKLRSSDSTMSSVMAMLSSHYLIQKLKTADLSSTSELETIVLVFAIPVQQIHLPCHIRSMSGWTWSLLGITQEAILPSHRRWSLL